jgi:archaellum component FlaG (FlaF/FlaG flagellin family)
MNDKKFLILIAAVTLVILFAGIMLVSSSSSTTSTPQVSASQNAKADTQEPTSFDFGNIPYSGPKATKVFTVKNTGSDILKFFNVKTSCHCTKANVTIEGKVSPDFGMSGISNWVGEVPAGKEAKVTAIFDQSFHGPQGVGPVTRFVSVETNDKGTPKITFTLTGTVVK